MVQSMTQALAKHLRSSGLCDVVLGVSPDSPFGVYLYEQPREYHLKSDPIAPKITGPVEALKIYHQVMESSEIPDDVRQRAELYREKDSAFGERYEPWTGDYPSFSDSIDLSGEIDTWQKAAHILVGDYISSGGRYLDMKECNRLLEELDLSREEFAEIYGADPENGIALVGTSNVLEWHSLVHEGYHARDDNAVLFMSQERSVFQGHEVERSLLGVELLVDLRALIVSSYYMPEELQSPYIPGYLSIGTLDRFSDRLEAFLSVSKSLRQFGNPAENMPDVLVYMASNMDDPNVWKLFSGQRQLGFRLDRYPEDRVKSEIQETINFFADIEAVSDIPLVVPESLDCN